jgi:hypothetical protein
VGLDVARAPEEERVIDVDGFVDEGEEEKEG